MFKLIKFIIGFVIFLVIAVIIFGIVLLVLNRGNKAKAITRTTATSGFSSISVNVDVKDSYVVVKKSKTENVVVTYYESKTRTFDYEVEEDLLNNATINVKGYQIGKWYNRIFLSLKGTKVYGITVEVPDEVSVNVKTNNGNIRFEDFNQAYQYGSIEQRVGDIFQQEEEDE